MRAESDHWTLVGRTDQPVLLLLDQVPDMVIDISDTDQVTELAEALVRLASGSRPQPGP